MKYFPTALLKMLSILNKGSVIFGIMLVPLMGPPLIYAATWPAIDAQETNVAAAIANASDGDTIKVPPGVVMWSAQLTITKHITLQGAGIGQTVIYDNAPKGGDNQHLILVKLSGDNPPFRLTGFEFGIQANYTVIAQPYGVGILEFQGGGGTVVPGMSANVRVDHCKIKVAGVAMTFRNVLRLLDHVEWIDSGLFNPTTASYWGGWQSASVYMPKWGGKDWGHGSWADAPNWGTDKFLFFEDCSFTGARPLWPIDAYQGARYVARNCTFKDTRVGGTGTEGSVRGTKEVECYDNTFISTHPMDVAQASHSGTILVHDNLETNDLNGLDLSVTRQYSDQGLGWAWGHSTGRSPWDENDDFPQAYESGTCTAIGSLATTARSYHTATLLANGNVLVAGGTDGTNSLTSAELDDSTTSAWRATTNLGGARNHHTATLLSNGTVLVAGGTDGTSILASAELYNPATGVWSATGSLAIGCYYHMATALANGTVLLAGGYDGANFLTSTQLYDPASGSWAITAGLGIARGYHTLTSLLNGKALVAGGFDGTNFLASAQAYDPAVGTWGGGNNVTDITKTWLPDQWLGDGVSFIFLTLVTPPIKMEKQTKNYPTENPQKPQR